MAPRTTLLCVLALAALLALLWPAADTAAVALDPEAAPAVKGQAPTGVLEAQGRPGSPGPALATRARAPAPSQAAGRADVQVVVVPANGQDADALVGLPVRVRDARAPGRAVVLLTDAKGRAVVPSVPLDGSVVVEAVTLAGARVLGTAPLEKPEVRLALPAGLPLAARFVDVETGRTLPSPAWSARPLPAQEALGGASQAEPLSGAFPGGREQVGPELEDAAPEGHVAWDPARWTVNVSRYAERLRAVMPLRREARVHVRAEEADGTPTQRATVQAFRVAGRVSEGIVPAVPDRGGWLLRGVPFYREEQLDVLLARPPARRDDDHDEVDVDVELVEELVEEVLGPTSGSGFGAFVEHAGAAEGSARLPREPEGWAVVTARFPPESDDVVSWCEDVCFGGRGHGRRLVASSANGTVLVTVLRADGRPAPAALVRCAGRAARTDLAGRVRFEHVPAGARALELREPGLVCTTAGLVVVAERETTVTLREAPGARLLVRVVDAEGEALPFAALSWPDGACWVDMEGTTQRVDPWTDHRGRRVLARFPPGTWTIRASWATRSGTAEVVARDGGEHEVEIRVE